MSNAGNWRSGSTPDRNNGLYYNGDVLWLKTGELNDGYVFGTSEKVTKRALNECSLPINDKGNVLIAMYGATIGKIAIAGVPLTTNQACCGCRPFTGIESKYLFYYLMANKENFIKLGAGGAQPNISREKIVTFPFLLPTNSYQKRLCVILDFLINVFF